MINKFLGIAIMYLQPINLFSDNPNMNFHYNVELKIPDRPLAAESLHVAHILDNMDYCEWNEAAFRTSYHTLQKIASLWSDHNIATQYLVYGKHSEGSSFAWEIVPFRDSSNPIGRLWQQFLVLWRVTFGGITLSYEEKAALRDKVEAMAQNDNPFEEISLNPDENLIDSDAFCNPEVIERQCVFNGDKVSILYDYAPISLGGEKLHFLFIPAEHRSTFRQLTESEYLEACGLAQQLINHFKATREIDSAYFLHKSGADAGQVVPHWHMHLIFTTNTRQDMLGKVTVLKNMLFGSQPLSPEELLNKVSELKEELKYLRNKHD